MGRLDKYLTVGQAANYLGVSISTLRNWDNSGKLAAFRHPLNGYRLYRQEDLYRLLCNVELASETIEGKKRYGTKS